MFNTQKSMPSFAKGAREWNQEGIREEMVRKGRVLQIKNLEMLIKLEGRRRRRRRMMQKHC